MDKGKSILHSITPKEKINGMHNVYPACHGSGIQQSPYPSPGQNKKGPGELIWGQLDEHELTKQQFTSLPAGRLFGLLNSYCNNIL